MLGIKQGMDLYVRCDAPPGSGTGSSSSISVALIGLLNCLQKEKLSPHNVVFTVPDEDLDEVFNFG